MSNQAENITIMNSSENSLNNSKLKYGDIFVAGVICFAIWVLTRGTHVTSREDLLIFDYPILLFSFVSGISIFIWMLIDCIFSSQKRYTRIVWFILIVVTGGYIGACFYYIFNYRKRELIGVNKHQGVRLD